VGSGPWYCGLWSSFGMFVWVCVCGVIVLLQVLILFSSLMK
jgi:hypothetical protein